MGGLLNLSSDFSLEFPCATHINALFGKTPIAKVTGAGGGEGVPSFDRDVPANICSKLHYIYAARTCASATPPRPRSKRTST